MSQQIVQVDAFTTRPFTGNPAAVCRLEGDPPADWWLQDVAREMNLAATAFLVGHEEGFDLRWFTPHAELDLCGHATLASAHVLWEDGLLEPEESARFFTRSGVLTATRAGPYIELDFPVAHGQEVACPDELASGLGVEIVRVLRTRSDFLVEVPDEKVVRTVSPRFDELAALDARGVIVTSGAISHGVDFVSRFFAPKLGIDEDPVTGSAHCALAPFWSARLDRDELVGYQVSPRGGTVRTRLAGDRVILAGQAVTVLRGDLLV